jgi:hypothetical protein
VDPSGNLVLRRMRLITAVALICVPWILAVYDISWHATLTALAIGVALGGAALGLWLLLGGPRKRRGKS